MAKDLGDAIGTAIGQVAREAVETVSSTARGRSKGSLAGPKGLAAGVGLAMAAPLATKGAGKLMRGLSSNGAGPVKAVGDKIGGTVKSAVSESVDKAGGAPGMAKEAAKGMIPGVGGDDDDDSKGGSKSKGEAGVGKGRRMPVQQDIDIGVPLSTVYNEWTQFEEWPNFMHRLENVSQEDESHVKFKTKIWGFSREFTAEIVEQRPDERIKWEVTEGVTHTGVVTFHELAPRLTRVEVNIDVQPGSLIEKAARGMRHVKRAVRADLARFKAHVLMAEEESGAWRGEIEDGDVKKQRSSGSSRGSSGNGSSGSGSSGSRSSGSRSSGSRSSGSRSSGSGSSGSGSSGSRSSGSRSSGSRSSGRRSSGSRSSGSRSAASSRRTNASASGSGSGSSSSSKRRSGSSRTRASSNGSSGSSRKKSGSRS